MADITLKNLTDIPVAEELAEGAHLLAEQDGGYRRVPMDKVGGGGGGALVVNITPNNDMQSGVADIDATAIIAAITEGRHVCATLAMQGGAACLVMQLNTYMPSYGIVRFAMLDATAKEAYEVTVSGGTDCSIAIVDLSA